VRSSGPKSPLGERSRKATRRALRELKNKSEKRTRLRRLNLPPSEEERRVEVGGGERTVVEFFKKPVGRMGSHINPIVGKKAALHREECLLRNGGLEEQRTEEIYLKKSRQRHRNRRAGTIRKRKPVDIGPKFSKCRDCVASRQKKGKRGRRKTSVWQETRKVR